MLKLSGLASQGQDVFIKILNIAFCNCGAVVHPLHVKLLDIGTADRSNTNTAR